jgi:uncharacterized protein (TIGR03437 family)
MKTSKAILSVAAVLMSPMAIAQGVISTIAGGTGNGSNNGFLDNVPATEARLTGPAALAVDKLGNAYIGDGPRVRRVDAVTGIISTVAGSGTQGATVDGSALQADLNGPDSFAFDASGNLLFVDLNRVVLLNPQAGTLKTLAGTYGSTTPQFGDMAGLGVDGVGNIYLSDSYHRKVNRIDAVTGVVTVVAGADYGSTADGIPATQATLTSPGAIALDAGGNLFFVDGSGIRRVDAKSGIITTVKAGLAGALAFDAKGNLYVAGGSYVHRIDVSTAVVTAVAGSGNTSYQGDGVPALQANLGNLMALAVDLTGNLWLADYINHRVFVIPAATGTVRTVAGVSANGDGGPALGALLPTPGGIAANAQGTVYVAAGGIRRIDPSTGFISTVAQGGPLLALDASGNLFFESNNTGVAAIQRLDVVSGAVTTVAGGIDAASSGDGIPATTALILPTGIALDASGNLYIAEGLKGRVRRVDAKTGIIATIAGNGGLVYSAGTGPATQIAIGSPNGIAVSASGDVYIAVPRWVLKVDSGGNLSVVAGDGGGAYSGDGGPALAAQLFDPVSLAFDASGNLFVAEGNCACIRRVEAATGLIQTVAGTGTAGQSADGIAATAAALGIGSIAIAGNTLYLTDYIPVQQTNGRVRAVTPATPPPMPQPPQITLVANAIDFSQDMSAGALVSVMGNYLGPIQPVGGQISADGRVTTALGGDQVTFNGIAAPLLYASAGQINTAIPYALTAGTDTVQVTTAGGSGSIGSGLEAAGLALFANYILNPDGTWNSAANPAPKGATLVLFGTGMGQTSPPGADGLILQGPSYPVPVAQFSASVETSTAFLPAALLYVGPLPGFMSGAVQVNVQIPDAVPTGSALLIITPNVYRGTQDSVTIYMR